MSVEAPAPPENKPASLISGALSSFFDAPAEKPEAAIEKPVAAPEPTPEPEAPVEVQPEPEEAAPEVTEEVVPEQTESDDPLADFPKNSKRTPAAEAKWSDLKAEKSRLSKENEELRKQIEEGGHSSQELQDLRQKYEELKQERETVEQEFTIHRVEATREYKKSITEPYAKVIETAKDLVKINELDEQRFLDLIHAPSRKELQEYVADLPEADRMDAYELWRDVRTIEARRQDVVQNAKRALETSLKRQQEEMEQMTRQATEARTKAFESAYKKLEPIFQKESELLPEDKRVDFDSVRRDAMEIEKWPEEHKAFAGFAAAFVPALLENNKTVRAERDALKAEITRLRNGAPKSTQGNAPNAPSQTKPKESPKTENDLAASIMSLLPAGR